MLWGTGSALMLSPLYITHVPWSDIICIAVWRESITQSWERLNQKIQHCQWEKHSICSELLETDWCRGFITKLGSHICKSIVVLVCCHHHMIRCYLYVHCCKISCINCCICLLMQVPNDYSFWAEQGMDPSHANYLHHGSECFWCLTCKCCSPHQLVFARAAILL